MDRDLRLQILHAIVSDRQFLKSSARDIKPEDFTEREERAVAEAALTFWESFEDPVGSLLHSEVYALKTVQKFGTETKTKLRKLIETLQGELKLVSVRALTSRVSALRQESFYEHAIDEILTAHEGGNLSPALLADLVDRAKVQLTGGTVPAHDLASDVDARVLRRSKGDEKKYPLLLIDPIDEKIRVIGRGHVGLWLAPYSGGKGMALVHTSVAYALQGYNVLYITLEDPKEEVENRFDSCVTGIPMRKLTTLPNRFKKRFRRAMTHIKGHIRVLDGRGGGWNCTRIEKTLEQLKREGFTVDCLVVDYDEELECEKPFKGDNARRFEFAEIYRRLIRMAANYDIILWTAAQGTRDSEGKKVITGKQIAEDISKARRVFIALGIGSDPKEPHMKHIHVLRHRLDRSRFGVDIVTDFDSAIFYDRAATMALNGRK